MKKAEFVSRLAATASLSPAKAEKILQAVLDSIEDALFRDGRVALPGLGVFDILERPERPGRNPANGEPITIAATRAPRFKPAKSLKDLLN